MALNAPDWLTRRPIAHRGLHEEAHGVAENTLEAAEAAARRDFSIECDVQLSADGQVFVFHDSTLDRLTIATGAARKRTAAELARIAFKTGPSAIPSFPELLARIAARVPIVCEIKSEFDGDMRLAEKVAALAAEYRGPLAIKSFDPKIVAHLRASGAPCPLGVVAQADYRAEDWPMLDAKQRTVCANFLHYPETRPDFLSFCVDDLPHPTPFLLRILQGSPVMAWTVKNAEQRRKAADWADQIIFEGGGAP
jgi:glycerophosphoryl diester phosphodiesterase